MHKLDPLHPKLYIPFGVAAMSGSENDRRQSRLLQALHGRPFAAAALVAAAASTRCIWFGSATRRLAVAVWRLVHDVSVKAAVSDERHNIAPMPPAARIAALLASSSINKGRNAPAAFA